mmetsp:Transcript_15357/g.48278  ORF Transcript_15357/g.48278 Transcript_15357/m.48278 type:complete len:286 (-) Transcript_15357:849-1706(-)
MLQVHLPVHVEAVGHLDEAEAVRQALVARQQRHVGHLCKSVVRSTENEPPVGYGAEGAEGHQVPLVGIELSLGEEDEVLLHAQGAVRPQPKHLVEYPCVVRAAVAGGVQRVPQLHGRGIVPRAILQLRPRHVRAAAHQFRVPPLSAEDVVHGDVRAKHHLAAALAERDDAARRVDDRRIGALDDAHVVEEPLAQRGHVDVHPQSSHGMAVKIQHHLRRHPSERLGLGSLPEGRLLRLLQPLAPEEELLVSSVHEVGVGPADAHALARLGVPREVQVDRRVVAQVA